MTAVEIIGSGVFVLGSLVLVWRGLDGVPSPTLLRYALLWTAIIVGIVLLLRLTGL
jgi:hypothetical protein